MMLISHVHVGALDAHKLIMARCTGGMTIPMKLLINNRYAGALDAHGRSGARCSGGKGLCCAFPD